MEKVYLVKNGCPLCQGDLKGNDVHKYYCKKCNILFDRKDITISKEKKLPEKEAKQVVKKIEKLEPKKEKPVEKKPESKPKPKPKPKESEEQLEKKGKIIVSEKSDKMHVPTCHFLKKIKRENWRVLNSIEEAEEEGYEKCVCVRRKVAKEKV